MLWCFEDTQGWGQGLCSAAQARGMECSLFDSADQVKGEGLVFMHMHHNPKVRARHKSIMEALHAKGLRLIPDIEQARLYDDKIAQTARFTKWMPETRVITHKERAMAFIEFKAEYPFVSKASEGSSSHNVRLVKSEQEAIREVHAAFGKGIVLHYKEVQQGYLLWQRFVKGNDFDIRVIAIGKQRLVLKRHNRKNVPFASGSGLLEHITNPQADPHILSAMLFADRFFTEEKITWCGIDIVFDKEKQRWLLLETTVGWTLHGYFNCRFFPDGRMGMDVWEVTLDEIQRGNLG